MSYKYDRDYLANVGKDTMHILNKTKRYTVEVNVDISDQVDSSVRNTILYRPDFDYESKIGRPPSPPLRMRVEVTDETTIHAALRLAKELYQPQDKIVILNFASARTPGGAFARGNKTQEESLARQTSLMASIGQEKVKEMYEYNATLEGPLYSDYMIYTPGAVVFRGDDNRYLLEPTLTNIITSPAPNLKFMRKQDKMEDVNMALLTRIRKIIQIAVINGNTSIVLGAFGCGDFHNNPNDVAKFFKTVLIDEGYIKFFDVVVFAIYHSETNINTFKKIFNL